MKTSIILAAAAACSFAFVSGPALAQATDPTRGGFCPEGMQAVISRVSRITGTKAGFAEAVHDHIKWYRDHGYTTNTIIVGPVIVNDNATPGPSPDLMMSVHLNDPNVPSDKIDDAWRAYVAKYRANSTLVSETFGCLSK